MNAVVKSDEMELPAPVARRGISESQWRTLDQLYPGARGESKVLVWDYCMARKLDPMKKPCHIVPMKVGDSYRDVVMPGIYEYRTTASRTGEYLGHSKPTYGPVADCLGVMAPEWCELTVYRWNAAAKQRCEFPVMVYFRECVATKWDKDAKDYVPNARWEKAPIQMLTKCTEAAALREGFPDEFGGEMTAEEMEGQNETVEQLQPVISSRIDPRGDTSGVDWELRDRHVSAIADIISEYGSDEAVLPVKLNEYVEANLARFHELYICVSDELAKKGIISKATFRKCTEAAKQPKDSF